MSYFCLEQQSPTCVRLVKQNFKIWASRLPWTLSWSGAKSVIIPSGFQSIFPILTSVASEFDNINNKQDISCYLSPHQYCICSSLRCLMN